MLNKRSIKIIAILLLALQTNCTTNNDAKQEELTLFAATSLTDAITELSTQFNTIDGTHIKLNLASSGTLVKQIKEGVDGDIFLSASKKWMDYISEHKCIDTNSICIPAKNKLVCIVPINSPINEINNLEKLPLLFHNRLSIGDPSHVPAGKYAMEVLTRLSIYEQLKKRLLPAKDVRSALMMVELAEAQCGIVYQTDALKSKKVKTVAILPDSLHTTITYHCAILSQSNHKSASKRFIQYIQSKDASEIWHKHGFMPCIK